MLDEILIFIPVSARKLEPPSVSVSEPHFFSLVVGKFFVKSLIRAELNSLPILRLLKKNS